MISNIINKIKNNRFGKNVILVAGGSAFSQALSVLFSPIITRIYPPEQYGILTTYIALLSLIAISASFDYQKAIPIAFNDDEAINLLTLSVFFLSFFVVVLTMILSLFGDWLLSAFDMNNLISYKYFIILGVLLLGLYNIIIQWSYRRRNYKNVTRTNIIKSVTTNFSKVFLGLFRIGPLGLILGQNIGFFSGAISLSTQLRTNLFKNIKISKMKYVFKRYKNFLLYSSPSNYFYLAGNNLPVILLAVLYDSSVTGYFGLAKSVTNIPISLIGLSVSQVFYSEIASIGKEKPQKIKNLSVELIKRISLIGIIPFLAFILFGPTLFTFVFGNQWGSAGIYAQLMSIMLFFHFLITPIGRILEVFEKQNISLIINLIRLILILLVFVTAFLFNFNSYVTIGVYSVIVAITYLFLLIVVMKVLDNEIQKNKK